jgi:hypothetical protein
MRTFVRGLRHLLRQFLAGGWTQTGDTGQINTATATAPIVANTVGGYAIFSSNDAGGGLNNFYFKIEFGTGNAVLRPSVWITFGFQGTDGAGNLLSTINPISTRSQIQTGANSSGATVLINFASGSGYFCVCAQVAAATAEGLIVSVERTKDSNLAAMNQISILTAPLGAFSSSFAQVVNTLNVFPAPGLINNQLNVAMPPNANSPVGVWLVWV